MVFDIERGLGKTIAEHRIVKRATATGKALKLSQSVLGQTWRADENALEAQERLRHRPALVQLADKVLAGRPGIVKEDLAKLGLARQGRDRAHIDSGLIHRSEQETDALLFLGRIRIGAHQHENVRSVMRHRGPDLLSVDDKVVPVNLCACSQVRQIGPGAGFRVSLAPDVFATQDTRQPVIFLFPGAEFDDQRPDHLHAHVAAAIDAPALLLFIKDQQLGSVQAHTAEFSGPGWCDPALGVKLAVPMFDLGELRAMRQMT